MSPVTRPRLLLAVLSAAIFVAVAALGLSVRNAFDQTRAERLRERDRIAADIAGCERGNDQVPIWRLQPGLTPQATPR